MFPYLGGSGQFGYQKRVRVSTNIQAIDNSRYSYIHIVIRTASELCFKLNKAGYTAELSHAVGQEQ